jgi:AcrR family transcriptional regulator
VADTVSATPARPKRGRRRDPRLDDAVLAATRRLLNRVGYAALSIKAIAREAGVHRPAIYRRWKTKAEIVHDAVYPHDLAVPDFTPGGDFAADLRLVARGAIALFSRREVLAAVPGMMADRHADARLQRRLRPRIEAEARDDFAAFLADAVARGDARAGRRRRPARRPRRHRADARRDARPKRARRPRGRAHAPAAARDGSSRDAARTGSAPGRDACSRAGRTPPLAGGGLRRVRWSRRSSSAGGATATCPSRPGRA